MNPNQGNLQFSFANAPSFGSPVASTGIYLIFL